MSENGAVDKRIVQMDFQNQQFEKGVKESIRSLENLRNALKIEDTSLSLKNIENSISSVRESVDRTSSSLASLEQYAERAFSPIERFIQRTKDAIVQWPADQLVKMFNTAFVKPLSDGMDEYEEKMGRVQTLTNAVKWSEFGGDGEAAMDAVNASLDRLNDYADKTIYSFKDMTTAFSKFVQQSDLQTAEESIVGLYNAAAYYGLNKQQGSMVSYNMAQALGKGKMDLFDWKSFENATMGGVDSKEMIINLGKAMGRLDEYGHIIGVTGKKAKEVAVDIGNFRETLQYDWFDKDVMLAWMQLYSGTLPEDVADRLKEMGVPVEQLAEDAAKASSEIKSFTQLWDTLGEALGTGWARTFEILFGDFKTLKERLTSLGTALQDIVSKSAERRNLIVRSWLWSSKEDGVSKLSTEEQGIQHITNAFGNLGQAATYASEAIGSIVTAIEEGLNFGLAGEGGLFSNLAANLGITPASIDSFTASIADGIKNFRDAVTSEGVFTRNGIDFDKRGYGRAIGDGNLVGKKEETAFAHIFDIASAIGVVIGVIQQGVGFIATTAGKIAALALPLVDGVMSIAGAIGVGITKLGRAIIDFKIFEKISTALQPVFDGLGFAVSVVADGLRGIGSLVMSIFSGNMFTTILNGVISGLTWIANKIGQISVRVTNNAKELYGKILPALGLIKRAFSKTFNDTKTWAKNLWESSKASEKLTAAWEKLKNIGRKVRDTLFPKADDGSVGVFDKITAKLSEFYNKVVGSALFQKIKGKLEQGFSSLLDNLPGYIDKFDAWITNAYHKLQAALGEDQWLGKLIAKIKRIPAKLGEFWSILKESISNLFKPVEGEDKMTFFERIGARLQALSPVLEWLMQEVEKVVGFILGLISPAAAAEEESNDETITEVVDKAVATGGEAAETVAEKGEETKSKFDTIIEFFNGLKEKIALLKEKVKAFLPEGFSLEGMFQNFDINGILSVVGAVVGIRSLFKLGSATGKLGGLFKSLGSASNIIGANSKWWFHTDSAFDFSFLKDAAEAFSDNSGKGIKKFLTQTPKSLVKGMKEWRKAQTAGKGFKAVGLMMLEFAGAIAIIAGVIYFLSKISNRDLVRGGIVILGIAVFLGIVAIAAKRISKGGLGGNGIFSSNGLINMLVAFAAVALSVIGIIAILNILSNMDPEKLSKGIIGLGAVLLEIAIFSRLISKGNKFGSASSAIGAVLKLALGLLLLMWPLQILGDMSFDKMGRGLLGLGAIMLELAIFSRLLGKNSGKVSIGIAALGVGLLAIVPVLFILSRMSWQTIGKGLAGMGAILLELAIFSKLLGKSKIKGTGAGLLALSAALLAITGVLFILAKFKPADLTKGLKAMAALLLELGLFMRLAGGGVGGAGGFLSSIGNAILIATALFGFVTALNLVSNIPTTKMVGFGVGMGAILTGFGIFLKILSSMGPLGGVSAGLTLATFTGIVGAFAVFLGCLDDLLGDLGFDLKASIAGGAEVLEEIGNFLGSFAHGLIRGIVGDINVDEIGASMTKLVEGIKSFADESNGIDQTGLGTGVGAIIKLGEAVTSLPKEGLIPFILGTVNVNEFGDGLIKIGRGISLFVKRMKDVSDEDVEKGTGALKKFATATQDIPEISALGVLITGITDYNSFAVALPQIGAAISGFANNVAGVSSWSGVEEGAKNLKALAQATQDIPEISALGILITGITDYNSFAVALPLLGTAIKGFANNVSDVSSWSGVEEGAKNLKALAQATQDIPTMHGLNELLNGVPDWDKFKANLPLLGTAIKSFSDNLGTISNPDSLGSGIDAIAALAKASSSIPATGGFIQKLVGDTGYEQFTTALPLLGTGIATLSDAVKDGTIDNSKIQLVADAIKILGESANHIYGTGGWVQKLFGEKDLGTFAGNMPLIATSLSNMCANVGESFDEKKVEIVAKSLAAMGEAAKRIPSTGGMWQKLFGEKDLESFTGNIPLVSAALTQLCINLGASFDSEKVKAAALSLAYIARAANMIPPEGGLWQTFFGEKSLGAFSQNMSDLGDGLASLTSKIANSEIQPEVFDGIIGILAKFSLYDYATGIDKMLSSSSALMTFGEQMKKATDYYNGVDLAGLEQTVTIYGLLIRMLTDMANSDIDWTDLYSVRAGFENIFTSVKLLSNDPTAYENIGRMGAAFMNGFQEAASPEVMERTATSVIDQFRSVIESDGTVKVAGGKVALDLVAGITENTTAVTTAAGQLGTDLITALKQSLDYANRHDDIGKNLEKTLQNTADIINNTDVEGFDFDSIGASIDPVVSYFDDLDLKTNGENFIQSWITGIESKFTDVTGAANTVADNTSGPLTALESSASSWGENVISGFVGGLNDPEWMEAIDSWASTVTSKVSSVTSASNLNEKSPSRLTYGFGKFVTLGFVNGMMDYVDLVGNSATAISDTAKDSMTNSLGDYSQLLAMGLNPEPTIRPVLDLSEIKAQSSLIGSMFGTIPLDPYVSRSNPLIEMLSRESETTSGVNPEIYSAVLRLEDKLTMLGERIEGMQVNLDGGALVGSIAVKMDKTLSSRATMAGRGN